jgi:two-component system sensor histidine kinase YesM
MRKYSLKNILIHFFIGFVIILCGGLVMIAVYIVGESKDSLHRNHRYILNSYVNELNGCIDNLYDLNLSLYMSNYDFQVLSQGTQISQKYLHESNLRNLITYRVYDTGAIFIFNQNDCEIYKFGSDYSAQDFLSNVALKNDIVEYCRNMKLEECFQWTVYTRKNQNYLLLNFRLNDLNVCSMLDLDRTAYAINKQNDTNNIYFVFSGNNTFLSNVGKLKGVEYDRCEIKKNVRIHGQNYVFSEVEITGTPVSLSIFETTDFLNEYSKIAILILIVAFGILTILVFIIFKMMSRFLLYPLKQIVNASELLISEKGETLSADEIIRKETQERSIQLVELEKINEALGNLLDTKIHLENENLKRKQEEEHAQLQYLQLQTRTHFFVNCLKSLYGMLESQQYNRMQRMILAFSNHIRYIFHDNMVLVTLREEIREINDYYSIIAMDRERPVIIIQNIVENIYDCMVPPLVIQTFIENSMKYSGTSCKNLQIVVTGEKTILENKERIKLKITDNGEGFTYHVLEKLNSSEDYSYEQYHVGINNLKRRLQLLYHQDYSIHFYNDLEGGACVIMYLPVMNK